MIGLLQRAMRAAFLRAEALLNRALGDRLDPLYHLGAIGFFLFWVVGATGLVLYALFDTSVAGAHRSVQAITEGLGGAVGVVRSVHRHASDALVAAMLLHLSRHFAFDRLRGFRAFSWITGVLLLVLAYVAGANGYMLPWDRLAQFVTQAGFEWLDWLPGFDGRLIRNVLEPERVSDRLFSLLVFVHIGVPLLMLLGMWVHVQRVPKAVTQPPRAIALALLAMLLALALAAPVASQGGPAELRTVPGALALDWYLLAPFALVDRHGPALPWALLAIGTLLLVALPWLPPRRGRAAAPRLTVHPGPVQVQARPGETLLEAGLRAGLALPWECRAGGCGRCACTVLAGRVDPGSYQPAALSPAARARGQALMCCAVPLEDVEIEVEGLSSLAPQSAIGTAGAAARRRRVRVSALERLAPEVMRVELVPADGPPLSFAAGQYLEVVLDDGARRAFSFASAPPASTGAPASAPVELHVRRIPGGRFTTHVFERMRVGDVLEVEGPLGRFTLGEGSAPVLFVAGATGFAPVKSILEDAFARGVRRPMTLYWGARTPADLYLLDQIAGWQRQHPDFRFVPVLSEAEGDAHWSGRRGLVHEALLADHPDLRGFEVYACGSLRMVQSAVPAFLAHGLPEQSCFSDAFVPSRSPAGR